MGESNSAMNSDNKQFHTTQWSVVLLAGDRQQVDAKAALVKLCERYHAVSPCIRVGDAELRERRIEAKR
jgi:hypothetical protein